MKSINSFLRFNGLDRYCEQGRKYEKKSVVIRYQQVQSVWFVEKGTGFYAVKITERVKPERRI